jgi:hypothetical protein
LKVRRHDVDDVLDMIAVGTIVTSGILTAIFVLAWLTFLPFIGLMYTLGALH